MAFNLFILKTGFQKKKSSFPQVVNCNQFWFSKSLGWTTEPISRDYYYCPWTNYSLSSVHGIFQARILECVVWPWCSSSRGVLVPQPGIKFTSPIVQSGFLTTRPPWKSLLIFYLSVVFISSFSFCLKQLLLICFKRIIVLKNHSDFFWPYVSVFL